MGKVRGLASTAVTSPSALRAFHRLSGPGPPTRCPSGLVLSWGGWPRGRGTCSPANHRWLRPSDETHLAQRGHLPAGADPIRPDRGTARADECEVQIAGNRAPPAPRASPPRSLTHPRFVSSSTARTANRSTVGACEPYSDHAASAAASSANAGSSAYVNPPARTACCPPQRPHISPPQQRPYAPGTRA